MDSEPREPYFEVDGEKYPVVNPDDMTMGEQFEFEDIAHEGIDSIIQFLEEDRWRARPLVAWMAVCIKRQKPETPMREILARLLEFRNADLAKAWSSVREESAGQSPPSDRSESEHSEPTSPDDSSASSETDRGDTGPSGTGSPGSDGSASVHPISESSRPSSSTAAGSI